MSTLPILFEESGVENASTLRVFLIFEDHREHPKLKGDLALEAARTGFTAAFGKSIWLQDGLGQFHGAVGAGKSDTFGGLRRAAFHAIEKARALRVDEIVFELDESIRPEQAVNLVEGALLSSYSFDTHKKEKTLEEKTAELKRIVILAPDALQGALERGKVLGEAVVFARNLSNEGPSVCTPRWLVEQARERAEAAGMKVTVYDEDELRSRGFNLHLAVARGSEEPARLLHATYTPKGEIKRTIALVGKGITFDSGGYSIKPADSMTDMHIDMGGGAAVIGAMAAIGELKPEHVQVHFIVPAAENLISGNAYKVNEIIRGLSGKTVEIHNTDAEGRLLLADALTYATQQKVDEIIDCATLTGAAVVGLGEQTAGVFSPDNDFRNALVNAANTADELLWPMPLVERIEPSLKSRVADLKNIGGRWGGAISAALFLKHFVGETRWAHIDLAGPAMADSAWEYINAGGTGYGVLLLTQYIESQSAAQKR